MIVGAGAEVLREVQDVANGRRAERIDRLGVITNHGQAAAAGFQRQKDGGLKPVGVLVLVDHDMVETIADIIGEERIADTICAQ